MAGFYERVGIDRAMRNNPVSKSENALKSEAQTVTEAVASGFSSLMDLVNYLIQNWQVTTVGGIALLLLIKRL